MVDKIQSAITPLQETEKINEIIDALSNINTGVSVTNCITKIPQDINLELNNGSLKMNAGSKVYIPNGENVFDEFVFQSDKTYAYSSGTSTRMLFYNKTAAGMQSAPLSQCFSGPDAPSSNGYWYDTTNNKVKRSEDAGATWDDVERSFPIAIIQVTNGVITSIDKVFNGFGYIGNTVFSLPGIKGLYPDGRYPDGTIKNYEITTTSVLTGTSAGTGRRYIMLQSNNLTSFVNVFYDPDRNILYNSENEKINRLFCGDYVRGSGGVVTELNPKPVFLATDYYDFLKTKNSLEQALSDLSSSLSTLDSNALHKTGNEDSTGLKNFQSVSVHANAITKGTAPSSDTWFGYSFFDKNGTDTAANRLAAVQVNLKTNGDVRTLLSVTKPQAGSTSTAALGVVFEAGGETYGIAPTPSSASDSSTKIATTEHVKACVPKSVGSSSKPVYTDSNGVVTACNLGIPGYSSRVTFSTDSYTPIENGLIIVRAVASSGSKSMAAILYASTLVARSECADSGGSTQVVWAFVRKGNTYTVSGTGTLTRWFVPLS